MTSFQPFSLVHSAAAAVLVDVVGTFHSTPCWKYVNLLGGLLLLRRHPPPSSVVSLFWFLHPLRGGGGSRRRYVIVVSKEWPAALGRHRKTAAELGEGHDWPAQVVCMCGAVIWSSQRGCRSVSTSGTFSQLHVSQPSAGHSVLPSTFSPASDQDDDDATELFLLWLRN